MKGIFPQRLSGNSLRLTIYSPARLMWRIVEFGDRSESGVG